MRLLKKILKVIFSIIGGILIILLIILLIDRQKTSYLNVRKIDSYKENTYILANVNIIPMTNDTVLWNKSVYIKDGVIQSVGEDIDIQNTKVIDGENRYLLPGLVDMHVHLWDKYELGLYLSNGVTAIRNVWGMPMHLRLKQKIQKEKIISPMFFTTGPKLTGPEYMGDDNLQLFSPEEARERVLSYKERGYDFIKSYNGLPEDIFDAIIDQAKISEMEIVAHPSKKVPYSYHFNEQIVSIEHAEDIVQQPLDYELDTVKLNQVVGEFGNSPHSALCPTLIAFYNIYNMLEDDKILFSEPVNYMNPAIQMLDSKVQFERWHSTKQEDPTTNDRIKMQHDFHLYAIKKLNDAGVNLISGTDAGIGITVPGFSIHDELKFYKEAGLSNYEVLKMATSNISKTHELMRNIGTIEEGKIANLLLLKENPLQDLSTLKKADTVIVKGKMLDRATLDDFEKRAYSRKNLIATIIRYIENMIVEK